MGFAVFRNRVPIKEASLRHQVRTGITSSITFEGWEACVYAGLDLERWANWDYDRQFMIKVVALYRLHNLVEAHAQSAVITKQEREARKARRKKGRR